MTWIADIFYQDEIVCGYLSNAYQEVTHAHHVAPSIRSHRDIYRSATIINGDRGLWGDALFWGDDGVPPKSGSTAVDVAASADMALRQILKQAQKIVLDFDEPLTTMDTD